MNEPGKLFRLKIALAFFAVYFIWGSTFSMVAVALKTFPPLVLNTLRFFIGGLALTLFCIYKKERLPSMADLKKYMITGIIIFIGGVVIIVWAQQYISSSLASIIITTPFWFIVLDKPGWKVNFSSPYILSGIALGLLGVILLVTNKQQLSVSSTNPGSSVPAILMIITGSFLWVASSLYLKYRPGNSSVYVRTTVQLLSAGVLCGCICLYDGSLSKVNWSQVSLPAVSALLYLAIASTTITFMAFVWLMEHRSPAVVSTYAYVNPVVAVLLGAFLLNERIAWIQVVAMAVILTGVLLVNIPNYGFKMKKV